MKAKLNNRAQVWIAGLAGLLFMLLVALIVNWVRIGSLSSRAKASEAANIAAERQIEENQRTLDYLNSPEYLERLAREELDLKKQGEEIWTAA
ncbi:hypothetical protein FACS1894211_05260 [Clostridia bacterium]|nr:hypothetical protein FACS1894211_05260 [Clostridia bacterium]